MPTTVLRGGDDRGTPVRLCDATSAPYTEGMSPIDLPVATYVKTDETTNAVTLSGPFAGGAAVKLSTPRQAVTVAYDPLAKVYRVTADSSASGGGSGTGVFKPYLTPTPVKSAAYTAAPGEFVLVDISTGSWTLKLPPTTSKWEVGFKVRSASAIPASGSPATALTVVLNSATDTLNGNVNGTLLARYAGRGKTLICDGAGNVYVSAGDTDATVEKAIEDTLYVTPSSAQALIDTRATGLRVPPIVRGFCNVKINPNQSFPSRILNFEPQRRSTRVQNVGAFPVQIAPKNDNNADYNSPVAATFTGATATSLAPGEEAILSSTLTHFARPATNGDAAELNLWTEAASA